MPPRSAARIAALLVAACSVAAFAQAPKPAANDPAAILARAKAATGGAAWNGFRTQHSKVRIFSGGRSATAERWVDIPTGRSLLAWEIGDAKGTQGFDGRRAWSREGSAAPRAEISTVGRELAVNAAYRDRLAFWFPERAKARVEFKEHTTIGVTGYDVVRITPEGGRPFEFWVNGDTGLIDRLVEAEAIETRTEIYEDFRDVQGVKVPIRVRATRSDDPRTDEIVTVTLLEYNVPLDGVVFAPEGLGEPEFRFPEGRTSVTLPFELHNGHTYVRAKLDGKGPFLMLFVPGGANVVVPAVARALSGASVASPLGTVDASLDLGGLVIPREKFAIAAPQPGAQRIEGIAMEGMVGLDVVRRFPVRLDYAAGTITIHDPDGFRYEGRAKPQPLETIAAMPTVRATIAGVEGRFGLDVGATTSVVLARPFWESGRLDEKLRAGPEAVVATGPAGPTRAKLARAPSLEVAGASVKEPVTLLSTAATGPLAQTEIAGTLGYGVLRRFSIVYDVPRNQVFVEPNAAIGEPDAFDRAGLWLDANDKGLSVVDVVAGGPAAQAGLKAGDVIVALDGAPTASMSLPAARERMRAAPGTKVRAKLSSGREVTIALRDIV